MDIADIEFSTGCMQVARQAQANIPHTLNRYFQTVQIITSQSVFYGGFQADKGAVGGGRAWVAAAWLAENTRAGYDARNAARSLTVLS